MAYSINQAIPVLTSGVAMELALINASKPAKYPVVDPPGRMPYVCMASNVFWEDIG